MSGYTKFDAEIYSEDLQPVTEQEFDGMMQMMVEENEAVSGCGEWSAELESENFVVCNGKVYHKPEPPSQGRIGGYEL